jgi:hypothetical protein
MLCRGKALCSGQGPCQLGGIMNEDREMLRTNPEVPALEANSDQRNSVLVAMAQHALVLVVSQGVYPSFQSIRT